MRPFLYWFLSTVLAALAAGAAEKGGDERDDFTWVPDSSISHVLPVPEPSRAMLLGIGIMAIAFTYRQAWLNLKRRD